MTAAERAEWRAKAEDAVRDAYTSDLPFGRMAALDSALWAGIGYMRPVGDDERDLAVVRGVFEAWANLGVTTHATGVRS